ncbi:acyl-CoA N-acyltransferase [Melampsora americana]|nr:acyl-CoA N-acyltransferase [Melampsora americana]
MKTCFEIFEDNMKEIYESSESGYSAEEKIEEMWDPEGRFIILLGQDDVVVGFLIWRFDWEETMCSKDVEVAYCYELQFKKDVCGNGLGRALMHLLEEIGKSWKMKKVMLTVHKANTRALSFYLSKMNYEFDEISPSQVEGADPADYEIMSKRLT